MFRFFVFYKKKTNLRNVLLIDSHTAKALKSEIEP